MKVVIEVAVKSVYGALKIYPVNDAAKALAELCGTKAHTIVTGKQIGRAHV